MIELKYDLTEIKLPNERSFNFLRQIINRSFVKFFYRGQINEKWDLSSSLERYCNQTSIDASEFIGSMIYYETACLKEIQNLVPNYNLNFSIPSLDSYSEWFSLIQHYGGKTRLLDFSSSFYIALFYTLQLDKIKQQSGYNTSAIWGVNYFTEIIDEHSKHGMLYHYTDERFNRLFKKYHNNDKTEQNQILVLNPKNQTHRMRVQNGLFLYGRNFERTLYR